MRKGVHRTAQHRVARSDKNETAPARAVVDAHAELQRSPSPEASQPRSPRSPIKAADADAASSVSAGLVAAVATAPIADPPTAQIAPERSAPRQAEAGKLLAPTTGDAASVLAAMPAEAGDDGWGRTSTWVGALLMTLGLVFVISSSRAGARRLTSSYVDGARALQGARRSTQLDGNLVRSSAADAAELLDLKLEPHASARREITPLKRATLGRTSRRRE